MEAAVAVASGVAEGIDGVGVVVAAIGGGALCFSATAMALEYRATASGYLFSHHCIRTRERNFQKSKKVGKSKRKRTINALS